MMRKTDKPSDCLETPKDLFDVLDKGGFYQGVKFEGFNFDIDLCGTAENSKCNSFCSDYLCNKIVTFENCRDDQYSSTLDWFDFKSAFINPPYSNPKPFIQKAWEDSKYCKIVCLVKCDPSTKWWSTFWDYDYCLACEKSPCIRDSLACERESNHMRGPKPGCEILFFPKRIKFESPKDIVNCLACEIRAKNGCGFCGYTGKFDQSLRVLDRVMCPICDGGGVFDPLSQTCYMCRGMGDIGFRCYPKLQSGPTFASALVIMDRRELF